MKIKSFSRGKSISEIVFLNAINDLGDAWVKAQIFWSFLIIDSTMFSSIILIQRCFHR